MMIVKVTYHLDGTNRPLMTLPLLDTESAQIVSQKPPSTSPITTMRTRAPVALLLPPTIAFSPSVSWSFTPSRQLHTLYVEGQPQFLFHLPSFQTLSLAASSSALSSTLGASDALRNKKVRIGIFGGGIAGVSAAHALARRKLGNVEILLFESDMPEGPQPTTDAAHQFEHQQWHAATSSNGCAIVPGASFFILSQASALWNVLAETTQEWLELKQESVAKCLDNNKRKQASSVSKAVKELLSRHDRFDIVPPYFALHILRCVGPKASADERWSFVHFARNYLSTILFGHSAADRGQQLLDIARSNRVLYLDEIQKSSAASTNHRRRSTNSTFAETIGHSQGFLAVHRTLQAAEESRDLVRRMGENAELLEWEDAVRMEPRLDHLPMKHLYVVRRPNDYTANCSLFVRDWVRQCKDWGVHYHNHVTISRIERLNDKEQHNAGYRVIGQDGSARDFDIVVLAAGVETPLLAAQLGVGKYCPTYPLRGFSLTFFDGEQNKVLGHRDPLPKNNLLKQPFKIDSMYCSSISPWMARIVGFGEFVGYRTDVKNVPSIGPHILSRYARAVFPGATHAQVDDTVACFRPMSPDDLPIVGEISAMPGVFLHTGHGSLGWTIGLVTGEFLAQSIESKLNESSSSDTNFCFPDETVVIERKMLSPDRFQ